MIAIEILLTFVYFLECTVVQCKDAFSIYWNRHGHECSRIWKLFANFTLIQCIKKVLRCFGARYIGDDIFFRAEIYRGRLLTLITGSSSRLLRIRFSSDLTVCHFRCMKFTPLVIWIWNQNIAISIIVGTSSHINCADSTIKSTSVLLLHLKILISICSRYFSFVLSSWSFYKREGMGYFFTLFFKYLFPLKTFK